MFAKNIKKQACSFAFGQIKDDVYGFLDCFRSQHVAREIVGQAFPGLGLKQTSMFLRDIGYADRLCVIDTHILWYFAQMKGDGRVPLTPKRYMELENDLLRESDKFGVSANVFDSAVWVAVKTFRDRQCTMQFA